ncbi:unnamed protein product [Bemisia tabaci]|uniref:Dihydrodipicolinate synthase-like n=1 Tax=Bemisia tabaci TaxID=7038 RepID=A0A9P0EWM0_BEMTA|nr:unnamed protein product [Bemisia tabaci]
MSMSSKSSQFLRKFASKETKRSISMTCSLASERQFSLNGVFPPLPTPFDQNENVDFDALRKNLSLWEKIPFKGYMVGGSNSELPFVSPAERLSIVKEARKVISDDKLLIGGSTCESTKATCELSEAMAKEGADGVLVLLPFYFKSRMNEAAILDHYTTVADKSPVPVVIYNMPIVTGIDIPISVLTKLSSHPNILGVKDGDVVKLAGIKLATEGQKFEILAGSAGYLLPGILAGCVGGINGLAVVFGEAVCQLHQLAMSRQYEKAIELQMKLIQPDLMLMREYGVPGLKAAMDILGYYGGPPRKPLQPIKEADHGRIRECLIKSGFFKL